MLTPRANPARESKHLMSEKVKTAKNGFVDGEQEVDDWPGIDSKFRLIVIAAQRSKQLQRGARPRIEADTRRRRNTSIALEEVKLGLVPFTVEQQEKNGNGQQA